MALSSQELEPPPNPGRFMLSMAVLLHDSGMHLTQDGFRALVSASGPTVVTGLGDMPWAQLWADFLTEAQRFGQERLMAVFGDIEAVNTKAIDLNNLSEHDCLLVGEFVRRHHARLAHEIALAGVPTTSTTPLKLEMLDEDIRDLSGLVARSHGMTIRNTFSYVEHKYGLVTEYRNIKAPFLMAILRIADYVQVQSERAIKSLLSVKELRSPISRQEWLAHFAVRDVSTRHFDPEALFVNAAPKDVKTYLKLRGLFLDIQSELDQSWATLGEVYGRQGDLAKLGLTIRRIRSTLDDNSLFASTVSYIPIKAGFDSSGPDLLKLLVGPLYGYNLNVGIRELLQNAVDACRELKDLMPSAAASTSQEADVVIEFDEKEDGTGWITVKDCGVGMTLDTVVNYFLIAGASFRNSDVWKKQHIDESGESKVLRGGRFGVGALAAFLLGNEIKVCTRHYLRSKTEGLEFNARIDEPIVEIRKCPAPNGTSIRIDVSDPKIFDHFRMYLTEDDLSQPQPINLQRWREVDWFVLSSPSVLIKWNGFTKATSYRARERFTGYFMPSQEDKVPLPDEPDQLGWRALPSPAPYKEILWRYRPDDKNDIGWQLGPSEVTVNGIRIQRISNYGHYGRVSFEDDLFSYLIRRPSISIFDPSGICPINLQRNEISFSRMGVDSQLAEALLTEHIKQLGKLLYSAGRFSDIQQFAGELQKNIQIEYLGQIIPVCATSSGFMLADPSAFAENGITRLFFVDLNSKIDLSIFDALNDGEALMLREAENGIQNDLAWFRAIFTDVIKSESPSSNVAFPRLSWDVAVNLISKENWALATQKGKVNKWLMDRISHKKGTASGELLVLNQSGVRTDKYEKRVEELSAYLGDQAQVAMWVLDNDFSPPFEKSLYSKVWINVLGTNFLDTLGQ